MLPVRTVVLRVSLITTLLSRVPLLRLACLVSLPLASMAQLVGVLQNVGNTKLDATRVAITFTLIGQRLGLRPVMPKKAPCQFRYRE